MVNKLTDAAEIVQRVHVRQVGGCRIIVLPYETDGVVTIAGSIASCPDVGAGEDLTQDLVNAMLDKGTRFRDQYAIASTLENAGVDRSYYGGVVRSRFSGRCLKSGLSTLFEVVSEELRYPEFDDRQYALLKTRSEARMRQSQQRTSLLAADALARHWFGPSHPNYARSIPTELALLDVTDLESVRTMHASHYGSDELIIVAVGDTNITQISRLASRFFGSWALRDTKPAFETRGFDRAARERENVYVHDKPSIDVVLGHGIPMNRRDPDFLPLLVGNFAFGGNFSSRLMQTIRDEMGLTYGIRSNLSGVSVHYDMLWNVHVTLGPTTIDQGVDAIIHLTEKLVTEGISKEELERAKETIVGAYLVRHDASRALAQTMLVNAERGMSVGELADYPAKISAVGLSDVNRTLRKHVRPESISIAAAGTVGAPSRAA